MSRPVAGIATDASHSTKNGVTRFRGIDLRTGAEIFHEDLGNKTVNIGEFLGVVEAVKYIIEHGYTPRAVYTDSQTAIAWFREKRTASKRKTPALFKAEVFLQAMAAQVDTIEVVHSQVFSGSPNCVEPEYKSRDFSDTVKRTGDELCSPYFHYLCSLRWHCPSGVAIYQQRTPEMHLRERHINIRSINNGATKKKGLTAPRCRFLCRFDDFALSRIVDYQSVSGNTTIGMNNDDNQSNQTNRLMGTVFHELGHFAMFGQRYDKSGGYVACHKFLRESYADYSGWHVGLRYYASLGYVPVTGFDLTGCAEQMWWKTDTGSLSYYSPLFVDLIDDHNQSVYYNSSSWNYDPIKNIPSSVIRTIVEDCTTWSFVKTELRRHIGRYYSSSEIERFIEPYDYWFARN